MVDFEQDHNGISSHNCLPCNILKVGVPMTTLHPGSLCLIEQVITIHWKHDPFPPKKEQKVISINDNQKPFPHLPLYDSE